VGREEEKKANKTAKGGEEEEKVQKAIRRIDTETGVCAMCGGSREAKARSEARTTSKDQTSAGTETGNRHEQALLPKKGMPVLWMAGEREHNLERTSRQGAVATAVLCGVWQVLSRDDRNSVLRKQCVRERHNASNSTVERGSEPTEGSSGL
jgi:hypothetical protein